MEILATSFQEPDKFTFYNLVVFVHVASAVIAFGVTFAYPLIGIALSRPGNERHLPWWHRMEDEIGKKIITPAATLILLAGIYLAAKGPYDFGSTFVTIGMIIIIVLLGSGGVFFTPHERRAAELAERDIAAAGGGEIVMSEEYQAVAKRIAMVGAMANLLILLAVFLMVMKPGA